MGRLATLNIRSSSVKRVSVRSDRFLWYGWPRTVYRNLRDSLSLWYTCPQTVYTNYYSQEPSTQVLYQYRLLNRYRITSTCWISLIFNHSLRFYLAICRSHQINVHQRWQVSPTETHRFFQHSVSNRRRVVESLECLCRHRCFRTKRCNTERSSGQCFRVQNQIN